MKNSFKNNVLKSTFQQINRYKEIISVLLKYGFYEFINFTKIKKYFHKTKNFFSKSKRYLNKNYSRYQRIRLVLEELGPTFIKLGQIMSNRPDLLPLPLIKELKKLQSKVPAVSFSEISKVFHQETGKNLKNYFSYINPKPIGSASIAQVYYAKLKSGEEVAVKIRRPNIEKIIENDLVIMTNFAEILEKYFSSIKTINPVLIIKEFRRAIKKELNFKLEINNIEIFKQNFNKNHQIYVPKTYKKISTKKVLIMEYITGVPISEIANKKNYNKKLIAKRGADLVLEQVFVHGFFHSDPHEGNILIMPNNKICFIDFGMMGYLNNNHKELIGNILISINNKDSEYLSKILLKLAKNITKKNKEQFNYDINDIINEYSSLELKDIDICELFNKLFNLIVEYQISIPPVMYILLKALTTIEGIGRVLDPDLNIINNAKPFVHKLILERYNLTKFLKSIFMSAGDTGKFLAKLPSEIAEIVNKVKSGEITIRFEHRGLEEINHTLDMISNRIVFAFIIASIIIGSSLIVLADIPPKIYNIPIIGLGGFIFAGIMGFGLLILIIRHGKM